jgi:hypothetical protein
MIKIKVLNSLVQRAASVLKSLIQICATICISSFQFHFHKHTVPKQNTLSLTLYLTAKLTFSLVLVCINRQVYKQKQENKI